ncbi:MAG: radical SAM protein [Campylobacteraceae bacterium]|nr:radical SAM protein [Campylobacteraceae bacterium]
MINYNMPLYRPPSEANNIIIQVTYGCSFNACTFCSMYRTKKYTRRSLDEVFIDIDKMALSYPQSTRVFLADGDALELPTQHLIEILQYLKKSFKRLRRVSSYASPLNLHEKTLDELIQLKENGLTLIYFGIETGDKKLLKHVVKGSTPSKMIQGLNKASNAGLKISATVILGLAGKNEWESHIDETAKLVNQTQINYLSTLQLGLHGEEEKTFPKKFKGTFLLQDDLGMLKEQIRLIEQINTDKPIIFRSNHASNALALAGNLPRDKNRLIEELNEACSDESLMKPSWLRGF